MLTSSQDWPQQTDCCYMEMDCVCSQSIRLLCYCVSSAVYNIQILVSTGSFTKYLERQQISLILIKVFEISVYSPKPLEELEKCLSDQWASHGCHGCSLTFASGFLLCKSLTFKWIFFFGYATLGLSSYLQTAMDGFVTVNTQKTLVQNFKCKSKKVIN